jgi:thiol-disulfide isomerase/thioredoxin
MSTSLSEIEKRTVPINQYIESLEQPFQEKFLARKQDYRLNAEATSQLTGFAKDYVLVVFSAQWCKDCATYIPVLALISEATGMDVRIFGGLKKDPLSHARKWRIPPSPPEVETFHIDKIPTIVVMSKEGKEIGRIVENPKLTPTLEQKICEIIKSQQQCSAY